MATLEKIQEVASSLANSEEYIDNLLYVREWDTYFLYEDGHYTHLHPEEFKDDISQYLFTHFPRHSWSTRQIDEIYNLLKYTVLRKVSEVKTNYIALKDCLINFDTFEQEDHDPDKIATHYIPISSKDLDQETPLFQKFLDTSIVDPNDHTAPDKELQKVLQEMFGFYMFNGIPRPTCFFLVGEGSNGKSVIADLLQALIGEKNTTAFTLETLTTDQYVKAELINKKLNVCTEDESKYIKGATFKALVSGDNVTSQRKFLNSITFRPSTKLLFCTNDFPTFQEVNHGLKRRLMIIPFHRKFKEEEQDKNLTHKLITQELGGIIQWTLDGAKRLKDQRFIFSPSTATDRTAQDFIANVSSAVYFFNENYELSETTREQANIVYRHYRDWCLENGRKPMSGVNFQKELLHNVEGFKEIIDQSGNKTIRYHNIKATNKDLPDTETLLAEEEETISLEDLKF